MANHPQYSAVKHRDWQQGTTIQESIIKEKSKTPETPIHIHDRGFRNATEEQ